MVGGRPRRRRPESSRPPLLASARISAMSTRTRRATSTICSPTGDITTRLRLRSTRCTPSLSSSAFSCSLKVGCVVLQRSAARRKCKVSAIATRYSSCRTLGIKASLLTLNRALIVARPARDR